MRDGGGGGWVPPVPSVRLTSGLLVDTRRDPLKGRVRVGGEGFARTSRIFCPNTMRAT